LKRTDLLSLALLGLAGVGFGLLGGDAADISLAFGLGCMVAAVIAIVLYRSIRASDSTAGDGLYNWGGPSFDLRQRLQLAIVGTIIGILFILFQLARG
jgi:hypothetical protein